MKMLFSSEISDFRILHNVLRAIAFKEFVIVRPMEEGLKFTLDEMKSVETSAYIPRTMFSSYSIDDNQEVVFKISIKILTECLNIFGDEGNPSVKLSYKSPDSPLSLVVTHSQENIIADCEIKTMNADDASDVSLAEECNMNKMVISANIFVEILQRLDNSADTITISLSPDAPYFTLITTGIAGESKVSISRHSESVTVYQCKEKSVSKYSFSHIRQILKVMNYANKVAISTGESSLLGMQFIINAEEEQMFVEYYVTAQFED